MSLSEYDTPIRYHDSLTGLEHEYRYWLSHYCSIHHQVCSPWAPVTVDQLLSRAANDPALDDEAFRVVAAVLQDEAIVPPTGAVCESCQHRPATDVVAFDDGVTFNLCPGCRAAGERGAA